MNKRYSIDEKIKIGQETFYRLIETEYGENVKEEMMKKYGIDATKLSTFLNMFKRHIVEPKPTEEELMILEKYYQKRLTRSYANREKVSRREFPLVKLLLSELSDEELTNIINRYTLGYIKKTIDEYIVVHPEDKDKLNNLVTKLDNIHESNKEERKNERDSQTSTERKETIVSVINEFLNGNDVYPNYVFSKNNVSSDKFKNWIKFSNLSDNEDIKELLVLYTKELKLREALFVNNLRELVNHIALDDLSTLDFYRKAQMPINKFRFFVHVARRRKLIDDNVLNILEDYTYKIGMGSYQYNSLEELKNSLNYNYNGVELTPEIIDNLCLELKNENIPINKSTVICLFQEKNSDKVNKR